jgi:hypothetical protein
MLTALSLFQALHPAFYFQHSINTLVEVISWGFSNDSSSGLFSNLFTQLLHRIASRTLLPDKCITEGIIHVFCPFKRISPSHMILL